MRKDRQLFLTSTGFDSLLAFDLDSKKFKWGFHLMKHYEDWAGHTFDPRMDSGPRAMNDFHINNVHVNDNGIFLGGLQIPALLNLSPQYEVREVCSLPLGTHNAQPFRKGVLFNDTESDAVRFVGMDGKQQAFRVKTYPEDDIQFAGSFRPLLFAVPTPGAIGVPKTSLASPSNVSWLVSVSSSCSSGDRSCPCSSSCCCCSCSFCSSDTDRAIGRGLLSFLRAR